MQKLAESLQEKYLINLFRRATKEAFEQNFEEQFKICSLIEDPRNTTMDLVFSKISDIATTNANLEIEHYQNDIWIRSTKYTLDNPFLKIASDLLDDFYYYLDTRGYINSELEELIHEMKLDLEKQGVVDIHGDFIKQNKGE